jgi:hypothetical protein
MRSDDGGSVWLTLIWKDNEKRSQDQLILKRMDALLKDDRMRWNFIFPKKGVEPQPLI